jgi:hypothetical protein
MKPLLNLIRGVITVVNVYKDGRMKLAQANFNQLPFAVQPIMYQFNTQVVSSLQALTFPLPDKQVPYGYTWDFPTDLFIAGRTKSEGAAFKMHFKYVGERTRAGRQEAIVEITGSLANNPNAKGLELVDPTKEEPKQNDNPVGEPQPSAAREQAKPPGVDDSSSRKGLYGLARGYAFVDVQDGFVSECKLFLDIDVELKVKDPQSKQDVPVIAGGSMELTLTRRTAR